MLALAWTLDTVGILARSAEDVALVLSVIAGGGAEDPEGGAAAGIPCVNIGPGGLPYNFAEEYVLQDEYLNAVRTYVAAALDFCNRAPA